ILIKHIIYQKFSNSYKTHEMIGIGGNHCNRLISWKSINGGGRESSGGGSHGERIDLRYLGCCSLGSILLCLLRSSLLLLHLHRGGISLHSSLCRETGVSRLSRCSLTLLRILLLLQILRTGEITLVSTSN
ncbi:hypothetical protein PMAYCL1PPCAC_24124, partial [Pristionchus mayeri]